MITSNTSIPFIKAENSENKFYLSRLTSEYNEGDSITTSTDINCRKLAIALKAGDKITINGTSLTVYADAAVDATSFFVEEITLDEALNINANIAIDEDNMFVQYQRKTEGTVAGFDIDADGMSKGGVEITGWLDSDTMEGATENNIPTAQSVKAYVDTQVGSADTLQEVTDNGNTTTNSIMIGSSSSPTSKLYVQESDYTSSSSPTVDDTLTIERNGSNYLNIIANASNWSGVLFSDNYRAVGYVLYNHPNNYMIFATNGSEKMRITSAGNVGIGTTSPAYTLDVKTATSDDGISLSATSGRKGVELLLDSGTNGGGDIRMYTGVSVLTNRINAQGSSYINGGNVGIGTTSPGEKLEVDGNIKVGDNDEIKFGTDDDLKMYHNATDSYIENETGNLYILNNADNKDIIFQSDDGSGGVETYFYLDGSASSGSPYTIFPDNSHLGFGSGYGDLQLHHNGTNSYIKNRSTGDLYIMNEADDKDIIFQSDDGAGGVTPYLTLDGSQETVNVYKNLLIGTTTDDGYKLDVNGTQRVQDVLELDDVLTLNAISTPDDPDEGKSSIYMDSADGAIKVKINFEGEVVTRTIASFDG